MQIFSLFKTLSYFAVPINDPIEPSLQSKFETEKLARTIDQCADINILRGIAKELLRLHEQKSAIATWATRRAVEAEEVRLGNDSVDR